MILVMSNHLKQIFVIYLFIIYIYKSFLHFSFTYFRLQIHRDISFSNIFVVIN